jgi:hypothetical protein
MPIVTTPRQARPHASRRFVIGVTSEAKFGRTLAKCAS